MIITTPTRRMARVSKRNPCPICERTDWCGISPDGALVVCMRIESDRPAKNGGWVHCLDGSRPVAPPIAEPEPERPAPDWARLADRFRRDLGAGALEKFAAELGVSASALRRLGIGWSARLWAWVFPMVDGSGRIVGFRVRRPNGAKFAIRGGHEGLFRPAELPIVGELVVCEGVTDTAAALTLGFDAIGRPSCTGAVEATAKLVKGRPVVIVADADKPGQDGAATLSRALVGVCPSVKIVTPPAGYKDLRAWVQGGATRTDVAGRIADTKPVATKRAGAVPVIANNGAVRVPTIQTETVGKVPTLAEAV